MRPTTQKVKEALISILGESLVDAKFLDLFAGTGEVGMSALNNGAKSSTFIEENKRASENIKKNLRNLNVNNDTFVLCRDVFIALSKIQKRKDLSYDIIFADPPYFFNNKAQMFSDTKVNTIDFTKKLLCSKALWDIALRSSNCLLILEVSSKSSKVQDLDKYWQLDRTKKYGSTTLLFFSPKSLSEIKLKSKN